MLGFISSPQTENFQFPLSLFQVLYKFDCLLYQQPDDRAYFEQSFSFIRKLFLYSYIGDLLLLLGSPR